MYYHVIQGVILNDCQPAFNKLIPVKSEILKKSLMQNLVKKKIKNKKPHLKYFEPKNY
jgi:hypothetical protein